MKRWLCTLKAQENDPGLVAGETLILQKVDHKPRGLFSVNKNNEAIIAYNPKLDANPAPMVSTFAHELAHYITSSEPDHSHTLAIFWCSKGISADIAYPHCSGNIKYFLKRAIKALGKNPYIDEPGKVEYI